MNYTKCPHCGSDTPAILSRCKNCHELLSNKRFDDSSDTMCVPSNSEAYRKKKYRFTKLIFLGIVAIIFVITAIKNPSVTESKQLIKDEAITKINEKLRADINDEDKSSSQQFGSILGMLFAPTIIDKFVTITVNDYIIFSTFKATIEVKDEQKNLASGIILFGNIIPISSDISNNSNQSHNSES